MAETASLQGTAAYLQRIAVPEGAVLEVELLDVSRADAPSVRLSSQRFALGGVPFPFTLTYDDALIDPRMTYAAAARISQGDDVLFRTTTAYHVLTRGAPDRVEMVLDMMPGKPATPAKADMRLTGDWDVLEIAGRMVVAEPLPTLQFADDGGFGMYAGCNRFSGTASIGAGTLEFPENIAATMMACPDPLDKLERDMLEAMSHVREFAMSGEILTLVNAAGVPVLRLSPAN